MNRTQKILASAALAAGILIAATSNAQSTVYFLDSEQVPNPAGPIHRLDVATGQVSTIGETGRQTYLIDFAPDGRLFGVVSNPSEGGGLLLAEIDPDTAKIVRKAPAAVPFGGLTRGLDLHFDRTGRLWIYTHFSPGGTPLGRFRIHEIDPQTGVVLQERVTTFLVSALGEDDQGFYAATSLSSRLFVQRVDFATGAAGATIPVGDVPATFFTGGGSDSSGRLLVLTDIDGEFPRDPSLVAIDPRDGSVTALVDDLPSGIHSPAIPPELRRSLDIPTASHFGLFALALALVALAVRTLRRDAST